MDLSSPEDMQEVASLVLLPVCAALGIALGQLSLLLILGAIPFHELGHYLVAKFLGTYAGWRLMPPLVYERSPGTWKCAIAGPLMSLTVVPVAMVLGRPVFEIVLLTTLVLAYASSDLEEVLDRVRGRGSSQGPGPEGHASLLSGAQTS